MARGYAYITTKTGKTIHYELEEKPDGFYFANQKVAPVRNWMQAEAKSKEIFRKIVEEYKKRGEYQDSHSSLWFEPPAESHTHSYLVKKPKTITPLKQYGMERYHLGFSVNKNIRYNGTKWIFDKTYYAINWYPTTPITLQITKSIYDSRTNQQIKEEKLSSLIRVDDTQGVSKLISKFRSIYQQHKRSIGR